MNLINKFLSKPYTCCMELHNEYECYLSIHHPSLSSIEGFKNFFNQHHFLIAHNMFDEEWEETIQLEEIYKKLLLIFDFDPNNSDIIIVFKKHKKVYLSNNLYVPIRPGGVFVYDKSKIKVSF